MERRRRDQHGSASSNFGEPHVDGLQQGDRGVVETRQQNTAKTIKAMDSAHMSGLRTSNGGLNAERNEDQGDNNRRRRRNQRGDLPTATTKEMTIKAHFTANCKEG